MNLYLAPFFFRCFIFSSFLERLSSIQRDADDIEDVDGVEAVDESLFGPLLLQIF